MFDDLASYFYENVVEAFNDYLNAKNSGTAGRSRDIRAATAATAALYHLREHLPKNCALKSATICLKCPDYSLLGDVANAAKHHSLTRGTPQISSATQIQEQIVLTEYEDEKGPYHWIENSVQVKLTNGSERDVLEVLINVMNYWQNYLHGAGVIPKAHNYSVPKDVQPKSRAECESHRLNFEVLQGHRLYQIWRLRKFNYSTGKIEPKDLGGGHLVFRLFRPNYQFDLTLKNEALGKEFRKTFSLGEEHSKQIALLQTKEEKEFFIETLPSVQQARRELMIEAGIITD